MLTLESALGGGVVLGGRDGCFRDLAGVHGTYRRVEETRPALALAARRLAEWGVGPCTWLLDAPVSNSGRLAAMIRERPGWAAEVVPDPDVLLVLPGDPVATADAVVLDRCGPWVNLARAPRRGRGAGGVRRRPGVSRVPPSSAAPMIGAAGTAPQTLSPGWLASAAVDPGDPE